MDRSRRWQAVGLGALALSCVTATAGALDSAPLDVPAGALAGREFIVLALTDDDWPRRLVPGLEVTLSFDWAGRSLTVQTGCGVVARSFRLRDGRLRVDRPAAARVPRCDAARTAQAALLLEFLDADPRVRLNGPALILSGPHLRLVLFERSY